MDRRPKFDPMFVAVRASFVRQSFATPARNTRSIAIEIFGYFGLTECKFFLKFFFFRKFFRLLMFFDMLRHRVHQKWKTKKAG